MKQFYIEYPKTNGRAFIQITNNQFRIGRFWIYKLSIDIAWGKLMDTLRRDKFFSIRFGKRILGFNW